MLEERRINLPLIILIVCLFGAVFSVTCLGTTLSKPESYAPITESLNEKKVNVEKLAGSAVAASSAITLIPGDIGTPIAEKLADLSGYFLIILCVIYIEKFLVALTGFVVFELLLPIGLVLLGISGYIRYPLKKMAMKIIALSVVLSLWVPTSVYISHVIETQYYDEIQQTLEEADANAATLQGVSDQADQEDSSLWSTFVQKVKGGSATLMSKFKDTLNGFVDAMAIYLVTSCIIPVLTLLLEIWVINMIFQLNAPIPWAELKRQIAVHKADMHNEV